MLGINLGSPVVWLQEQRIVHTMKVVSDRLLDDNSALMGNAGRRTWCAGTKHPRHC